MKKKLLKLNNNIDFFLKIMFKKNIQQIFNLISMLRKNLIKNL